MRLILDSKMKSIDGYTKEYVLVLLLNVQLKTYSSWFSLSVYISVFSYMGQSYMVHHYHHGET